MIIKDIVTLEKDNLKHENKAKMLFSNEFSKNLIISESVNEMLPFCQLKIITNFSNYLQLFSIRYCTAASWYLVYPYPLLLRVLPSWHAIYWLEQLWLTKAQELRKKSSEQLQFHWKPPSTRLKQKKTRSVVNRRVFEGQKGKLAHITGIYCGYA